jgi:polysaccharide export outer membrane protein
MHACKIGLFALVSLTAFGALHAEPNPYILEPPDIVRIEVPAGRPEAQRRQIAGEHLLRPDGTISLGGFGAVPVAGLTLLQARAAVEKHLGQQLDNPQVLMEVIGFNSKVCYLILSGDADDMQVYRFALTGKDTVRDVVAQVADLPAKMTRARVHVARPSPDGSSQTLPVRWKAITRNREAETNYQVVPGDRIVIKLKK